MHCKCFLIVAITTNTVIIVMFVSHNLSFSLSATAISQSVLLLGHVQLFVTPWTAVCQAFLSITISQNLLKLMSIKSWCHSTISFSVVPFSCCLQCFPASGSLPMSQFFASGGQSIGASASVLLMNIQDWFPLGFTGLSSLQSGDSAAKLRFNSS